MLESTQTMLFQGARAGILRGSQEKTVGMPRRSAAGRKFTDGAVKVFSFIAVGLAVGMMLWILATVIYYGHSVFSFDFLFHATRPYGIPGGGIANAFLGTVAITAGAAVIAVPPALLAGVYLSEFHDCPWLDASLRFSANVMMGMPSVIVGLFVYVLWVVPAGHFSGFAASLALAIIMYPVILRTTEDILGMVPVALRESALALGMSRLRTTLAIVCRAAKSGLLTGVLLSLARVGGETAPLLFTALFSDGWVNTYFTEPTASLPVLITEYATNSPFEEMHAAGWGAALAVTVLVLVVNLAARILLREKNNVR